MNEKHRSLQVKQIARSGAFSIQNLLENKGWRQFV
jgi:hypothetical protein